MIGQQFRQRIVEVLDIFQWFIRKSLCENITWKIDLRATKQSHRTNAMSFSPMPTVVWHVDDRVVSLGIELYLGDEKSYRNQIADRNVYNGH